MQAEEGALGVFGEGAEGAGEVALGGGGGGDAGRGEEGRVA